MVDSTLMPTWFMNYGILLEALVLIVTLFVAIYSDKIYKLTKMKNVKYVSIAFSLFSVSFLVLLLANLFYILKMQDYFIQNYFS